MIFFQEKDNDLNACKVLFLQFITIWSLLFITADAADNSVWFDKNIHQSGIIQVKFINDSPLNAKSGKLTIKNNNNDYTNLIQSFLNHQLYNWEPVFKTEITTLKMWRNISHEKTKQITPDLTQFFYLKLDESSDTANVIAQLRQSPLVEAANPVGKPVAPPLPPDYETINDGNISTTTNHGNVYQRYLNAAPEGIDIHYAREGTGGRGAGINICDVEYGWNLHTDNTGIINLKPANPPFLPNFWDHGTAVLGMLNSTDNGWGTTGMLTEANIYFSPSVVVAENLNHANAISTCMNQINIGDVILIEQQVAGRNGNFVPVEWDFATYTMIKVATNIGYIVVEAAGNGNENLDHVFYQTAQPGHAPFTNGNDSGAILVGSSYSPWIPNLHLTRNTGSTYGSTVDLHAWGQDIIVPGYGDYYDDEGDLLSYKMFGGTSGASPMVTAAVAIIQANYIAKNGSRATPDTIKQLLIDTGTPQEMVNGQNIGPMPDLRNAIDTLWDFTELTQPIISPTTGAFSPPINATIDYGSASQNSSNTHIRYTLDGSEPTVDSYIYLPEAGDSIYLLYTTNVKAKAFRSNVSAGRLFASPTASETLGLIAPTVATPQISPNGGVLSQPQTLTITSATAGATIKYRKDGRAPSLFYPGTTYNGSFSLIPGTYNFTARAYKDGFYKSDTAYAQQLTITPITLPTPTIYPAAGVYSGQVSVYIGSTVLGAEIRYTTNGSTPTASSALYDNVIAINSTTTVKARIYLPGYSPSSIVSNTYTIINQAVQPIISPNNGSTANDSMLVTMSTVTNGAIIRYTTNGAEPTTFSSLYSAPFTLLVGQHTLKAKAFLTGASASNVSTASYTVFDTSITVAPPTITPVGGIFNGPVTITMSSDTQGVSLIFYTTDGSDPASSSTFQVYNGPFNLTASNNSYFIKARAYLSGSGNSNISSATFTIVNPVSGPVATPTITPESGEYNNSISVSVQAPDFSSPFNIRRLYVTRNGDIPFADFSSLGNGSSGVYNFSLSKPETVQALAAQAGWFDSANTSTNYDFKCATPDISSGGTFVNSTNVSINTITSSSTIYYTLDGSDPTTSDIQYNSPFTVSQDRVVKAMCTRNNFTQSDVTAEVFLITALTVAPVITTQPQAQLLNTCDSTTLSVATTGTSPFSYQWYKDGNVVGGATEVELELLQVSPASSGNYHVTVNNDAGNATSNTATIIVPIFISGFEAGEITNSCGANNRSKHGNNYQKQIISRDKTNSKSSVNQQLLKNSQISSFTTNNNLIYVNKSNLSKNNPQSQRGDGNGGAQIIPSLNIWMQLLLMLMVILIVNNTYRRNTT